MIHTLIRLARRFAYLACLAWLITCAGMYFMQRKLLYIPQPRQVPAPLMAMPTADGDVLVSVRERSGADALIYFGGNAEDVSFALDELAEAFPGHALYLLHYRGFGGSAGEPTEAALIADALGLFDLAHARHPNVAVIGRSLGSGVAVQLAASRPVQRLALVTPFASVEQVAKGLYPWLPVTWLLKDKFDSLAYAPKIKAPTLIITAGHDQLVPAGNTQQLIARVPPALLTRQDFPGAEHYDITSQAGYAKALRDFLAPTQHAKDKA